jgi:hypothetical protein
MKNIILLVFFVFHISLFGRNLVNPLNKSKDKNFSNIGLYIDGGTFGIGYSTFFNIEKYISSSKSEKIHLFFRGSYGDVRFLGSGSGGGSFFKNTQTIGASITMITGRGNHHFDSSTGLFYRDESILPLLDLGYRYQKLNGGIILKGKIGILGLGFGMGYSF